VENAVNQFNLISYAAKMLMPDLYIFVMGRAGLQDYWIQVSLSGRCCEVHSTKTDSAAEKKIINIISSEDYSLSNRNRHLVWFYSSGLLFEKPLDVTETGRGLKDQSE